MISQALVFDGDQRVLMVRQRVKRGDAVWNFPGGRIEAGESPQQACVREVWEETGFTAENLRLLKLDTAIDEGKYTFLADIAGGRPGTDRTLPDNDDILGVAWVSMDDSAKWDRLTLEILAVYRRTPGRPAQSG